MTLNSTIQKARLARDEGRLWRAKEILQGRLASHPFDADTHEELGSVLLEMGDIAEAGRFLFISGARKEAYTESIKTYLDRYSNTTAARLHSSFPSRARAVALTDLPSTVADELKERGFTKRELRKLKPQTLGSKLENLLTLIIALIVMALFCFGLIQGIKIAWSLVS